MRETDISNLIRMTASKLGARLFRNHRGKHLTMDGKRIVETGLAPGASDLIGWTPVTITPEMVGRSVAVFTACEVKSGRRVPTTEQGNFLDRVNEAGGIGFVARSEREAADRLSEYVMVPIRVRC